MPKRKEPEDKPPWKSKPGKRVAFSAPKTAATKAAIARNASTSPLLRLPLEIRTKIWTEVLGDRLIHIAYDYDDELDFETNEEVHRSMILGSTPQDDYSSAWKHVVCEDDCREDRPDEEFVLDEGGENERTYWLRPHSSCNTDYFGPHSAGPVEFWDHETMRLTVLRSSRQIYVETNQILWTTNTFSFANPVAFKRFMMTRNIKHKRLIRHLRLEMDWQFSFVISEWNSSLNMSLVRSLSGLSALRLHITHNVDADCYREWCKLVPLEEFIGIFQYYAGLRRLSTLPLTSAEIVLRNFQYQSEEGLWTKNEREELADSLQRMLLNPRGAEVYAEAQKKLRQERKRHRELELAVLKWIGSPWD